MVSLQSGDLADAGALRSALERELSGLVVTEGAGDLYLFYDPDDLTVPENRLPFVTVVTGDRYDAASQLDRDPGTYRVNLGIGRDAYEELLGAAPREPAGHRVIDTGADYTATDTVLPHPFYAPLHWVCIVDPGPRTQDQLAALVEVAYSQAVRQYDNRRRRTGG